MQQIPEWLKTEPTIPMAMLNAKRWLVHRNKQPFYVDGTARRGELDSPEDISRLGSYEDALERVKTGFDGLGFALGDGWQGIDLDKIEQNNLHELAESLPGYVERSPSGLGLHAIGFGQSFDPIKKDGVECYSGKRFFTVTGDAVRGDLSDLCGFVEQVIRPVFGRVPTPPADRKANQPVESVNWELVESAVNAVDPSCSRDEWIKIGFGLNHAAAQYGEAERAFTIWRDWSAKSDKYPGDREMAAQWRSFDAGKSSTVTLGTVFEIAGGYGWKRPLIDVSALFDREKQRELNRIIGDGETEAFCPLPDEISVDEMLERFVFLADGARVFDRLYPMHIVSLGEFKQATAASVTEVGTGDFRRDGSQKVKRVPNADVWVSSKSRLSVIGTTFKAGATEWQLDPQGRHSVNLWTGFRRNDVEGGDPVLFLNHVRWLFKDRADDFLDWLAHIEQKPGELPHTAWLHISSKTGTGRNALSGILARVFAGYAATSLDLIHLLESGFNERLSRKVLAVVDEIREGGSDQWRHAESLKQMITSETRSINKKFGRMSEEFNACRFLLFSNHRQAIPLDETDRRFEVVINDDEPQSADYYQRLYGAINRPSFITAVAQFLRDRNLSGFNPGRHAAKSADKKQVITSTGSDESELLFDFSESYPLELVTTKRLAHEAGIDPFSKRFTNLAIDAGWIKLGRKTINGQKVYVWCRRSSYGKWQHRMAGHELALPRVDGGSVDLSLQPITFPVI